MSKVLGLNLSKLTSKIEQRVIQGINQALENRVDFIEKISPEDTGDYVESHYIRKATSSNGVISGANANDSEHAAGVEDGFRSKIRKKRRTPVNWSKKDNVTIYNGVGAKVMQRTTLNPRLKQETISIINQSLATG